MFNLEEGDIIRVRVGSYTSSQAAINTYHLIDAFHVGDVTDVEAASFLANAIDTALAPLLKPMFSAQATYQGVSVQPVNRDPIPTAVIDVDNAGVGTAAGELLPGQSSGILTLQTDLGGPRYRGRLYVPWPTEGLNGEGIPTAGYVTLLDALGAYLSANVVLTGVAGSITLTPCIYHRDTGLITPLAGTRSNQKWATQKRRGSYGQRNIPPF